ncbi:MAG: rod shape-determining protein MreC [Phycisphaerales bacterium]
MPLRPSIRRFIAPAFWFAVVVCAFLPARLSSFATPLHNFVAAAVNPPSRLLSLIGSDLRGRNEQPVLDRDLQRLSGELLSLRNLVIRYQDENERLRADNAALQELSRTLGNRSYTFRLAQVMSRSVSPSHRAVTINLGSRAGITENFAAVSGPNLVGRVTATGSVTSDIRLITSAGQKLEAVLMPAVWPNGRPPENRRQFHVLFQADGTEYLTAVNVPRDTPVQVGDIAHLADNTWPDDVQGMVLGRVTEVTHVRDPVLFKKITLRPLRALSYLDQLTVIVPREAK